MGSEFRLGLGFELGLGLGLGFGLGLGLGLGFGLELGFGFGLGLGARPWWRRGSASRWPLGSRRCSLPKAGRARVARVWLVCGSRVGQVACGTRAGSVWRACG